MNATLKLPSKEQERIKKLLLEEGFEEVQAKDALWALRKEGVKVVLYPSGTLLLQGKGAEETKDRLLELIQPVKEVVVGCDESGKGDVFGPLVLCCAVAKPEHYKKVLALNIRDCKRMSDEEVVKKFSQLKEFLDFRHILVEPSELNELYERHGNLNRILHLLYGELLGRLLKEHPEAEFRIDAYAKRSPFPRNVIFEPEGEKDPMVASASVCARALFLEWLRDRNLPKGSSREVMELARRLYRKYPEEAKRLLKTFFL